MRDEQEEEESSNMRKESLKTKCYKVANDNSGAQKRNA